MKTIVGDSAIRGILLPSFALGLLLGAGCTASTTSSPPAGTGGASDTGGTSATGGDSGSGGSSATGGSVSTGGTTGSGGVVGSGGSTATGGTSGTGGTTDTGGSSTTGGSTGSGGASGRGGATGSGGTASSGGTTGAGGRTGTGGASATGGTAGTTVRPDAAAGSGGNGTGGGAGSGGSGQGGSTGSGGSGMSSGCGKASGIPSSQYNNGNPISITVNNSQRRYILSVPTNYVNTTAYKLILGIHALNSNDKSVYSEKYYGLQPLSNNTVIFAAPNGVKNGSPCSGTGTGDSGCGWPSGNNNMELMDAVVKQVSDNFCVDMNHIYATGWSYGASMSYEVGCQRPLGGTSATWGVRAVALYALAQMSGSCKPSIPIGYYLSHGINDSVLGYDGGVNLTKNYATTNGCTWATPPRASGAHICTNLSGCKTGYPVEFCSFVGDHTAYPDSGNPSNSWGPAEVWKFLSQF
jgi:poly(3-hydroxybutyrate) depolymerase